MKTTKRLLALLMVMTLLLSYLSPAAAAAELTDTANPTATESPQQTDETASTSESTVISLWTFPSGDLTNEDTLNTMIADFQEEHPGIELQVNVLSYETGYAELEEAIANGTAPDLILESPETVVANYGTKGLLADLSDLLDDEDLAEIYPNALAAGYGADGKLYQYPFYGTVHTMAINKTVFEAAGAMQYLDETSHTWNSTDDFFKAVQAVYESTEQAVGGVPCESIGGDQASRGLITNLYGGTFTNAAHTAYTWDSEEMIAALEAVYDFPGIDLRTDLNGGEEIDAFVSSTLNMAFCWNPAQHLNCGGTTSTGDEILMMAFPSDAEPRLQNGLWGFGVFDNGDSARIEAAKAFIKFMCDSAYTGDAVKATTFYPLRTSAEGIDLSGIWAEDSIRNDFNSMMHMMGDYYQVTTNWRNARTSWINLLQAVASGEDIASNASYWNGEANGTNMTQISALVPAYGGDSANWWAQFEIDYEQANPGVDLVLECVSWNDIYSRLNEGYTPDILNIDIYEEFVDRLLPVQEYMSQETYDKFYPCFLAQSELDGTVWAVPDLTSARGLYVNTDMLDAIGMEAPATWAELEAVCAAIREHYGDEVIPFGLDMSENEGQLAFALAAWNNGSDFVDENGSWYLNSDANVEAVEFLIRMYNSGYTNNISLNRYDIMDLFSQGQVAMMVAPSGWGPGVSHTIAPIPANEGCESWSLGVMDRMMCFDNDYTAEELDGITAFFDMFYDDARHADWVFMEGFLPATSTGMEKLAQDQSFLAPWVSILPNCKFYPANVEGWGTVRGGVIGLLGDASNGGDVRALLDDLQAQLSGGSGGGEEMDHSPFLSFRWLDNWGDGWFQLDDWKYDGNDWCNGYLGFGAIPGDEFWMVYYLNTWNEETQSFDATPVHVDFSQQLSGTLLYDTDESIMPGAEDPEYYYRLNVLEDTWDQVAAISYTMDDGTVVTMELGIWRGEAGFYNSPALRNDTYIRDFYYDQINTDENVFYFGFQSDYWTLESVEPVLGHLGIPGHDASDVFTVEKVNDNVYKITLTPWVVSTGYSLEVGLNLYLTDPEGNSNNGEWYHSIWCHNTGSTEDHAAIININGSDYHFFPKANDEMLVYAVVPSGEYNDNGDEVCLFQQVDLPDGFSYDLDTNTVTLNNVSLNHLHFNYDVDGSYWLPNADVTIMLVGDNTISCDWADALGLGFGTKLTISGDGSLKLYSENRVQTDENGNYIFFHTVNMHTDSHLTIGGNAAVTVEIAGEALESCWDGETWLGDRPAQLAAIEGGNGSLTLKGNGSLTTIVPEGSKVNGPKLENEEQVIWDDWYPGGFRGIRSMGTITITQGSTLDTQEIEIPAYWDENGFAGAGSFIQSGGTVNITAHGSYDKTEKWEWNEETQEDVYLGIVDHYHYNGLGNYEGGYVEISGGQLNIKCLQTEEEMASSAWADGIRVGPEGRMVVSGGTVNVEVNRGYAVTVDNLTVTGGTLNAISHDSSAMEVWNCHLSGGTVNAEGRNDLVAKLYDLTIDGGTLYIRNEDGSGIYADNILVTDGLLDIQCDDGGCIDVWNSFTVEGGTVNLSGKYGDVLNLSDADAVISGGTVTVTGEGCLLIGVGGWEPDDRESSADGTLTMTGGKLISNYTGSLGTALETRPLGHTTITGEAQVELNGHLVNYGTMDIAKNASVNVTNGGLHMENDAVLNISGGTTNIRMSRPEDRAADEFVEMGWLNGDINVTGGELLMEGTDLDRIIYHCGSYYQSGGKVSFIANISDEWKAAYTELYGTVPKPYSYVTEGEMTIDGGELYTYGHYGITLEAVDTSKLTVNGGEVWANGDMNGLMLFGPAVFNGGSVHVHSYGRETENDGSTYYGGNGIIMAGDASSLTINGGSHDIHAPINEGIPKAGHGIMSWAGPFYFNGGIVEIKADIPLSNLDSTDPNCPYILADDARIHSMLDGHVLEIIYIAYYDYLYDENGEIIRDEDGNPIEDESVLYYDFWLEEDGVYNNGELPDLSTHVLLTTFTTCGENTTWNIEDGQLIISGTGAMDDYASGDETPWSKLRHTIKSIVVEAGVTGVGSCAFADCTEATEIKFLGDAPAIGENAFLNMQATAYYYEDAEGWKDNLYTYGGCIYWEVMPEEDSFCITTQPADYVGLVGDIASFTVATNAENVSYRWFYSKDGGETWLRTSNTTDTYSLEFLAYRLNYQYRCEVTNNDTGAVLTSEAASLLAEDIPLEIITQPVSYVGAVNDDVTFQVEAVGNGLVYEWFFSNDGGETWGKSYSPGYQTDMLCPILRTHRDGNMYKCVITDVFGDSVTTEIVSMSVKASDIIITAQPQTVDGGMLGQLYTFTVEATGDNLTYRWQVSSDGGVTWQESWNQGYNSATLNVRLNANRDGNQYRCIVTSGLKTVVISDPAVLNLQAPSAAIVSQSGNVAVVANKTATFTVEAEGTDLTYLWYRSNDKGATWAQTFLSGYNTDTLSFVATTNRAAMYMCKVTDGSGKVVWSEPVKLQILSAELKILTQPVNVTCASGDTATFTVEAQGDTLKYQWYASADGGETWTVSYMTGYNTNEFSFVVNANRAAKLYKCVITDLGGNTVETDPVSVTIN